MVENKYSVPKKQWKKWNDVEQQCFIDLYEHMVESPEFFTGTINFVLNEPEDWEVIAWNVAFSAADLQRYNRKFNG